MDKSPQVRTESEIREWILDKLLTRLHLDAADIHLDEPLITLGVDSMQFVVIVGELEDWLGCRFADNPLIDYPSINALSVFLAEQLAMGKTVIDPTHP